MDKTYNISQLSKEFKITTRSIRYYEDFGLLSPARKGSRRIYSKRDHVRLKLTLRGKRLGFSLAEIKEILDMYDGSTSNNRKQIQVTLDRIEEKRAELNQQMADIEAMQKQLDDVESRFQNALNELNSNNNRIDNN